MRNVRRAPVPFDSGVTQVSGSDSAAATETGVVAVTAPGSDAATLTEATQINVTLASSDAPTAADTGTVAASVPGSDSGAASDTGVPLVAGSGSDSGTGTEGGTANVTASASDSATATEGQTLDTGGTPVSGSDSATAAETGTVAVTATVSDAGSVTEGQSLDTGVTPPAPPSGPTGGADLGDETSVRGETRHLTGHDSAVLRERWWAVHRIERPVDTSSESLPEKRSMRLVEGRDEFDAADREAPISCHATAADRVSVTERFTVEKLVPMIDVIDHAEEAELEARVLAEFDLSAF